MNIKYKNTLKLLLIALFIIVLFTGNTSIRSQEIPEKTPEEKIKDKILLEVSSVIGQPSSILEFTIRNNSDQVIWAHHLNENSNFTILQNPLDKLLEEMEFVNYARWTDWMRNLKIKPSETKSWRYDIAKGLWFRSSYNWNSCREFSEDAGTYQLYWRVNANIVHDNQDDKRKQSSTEDMEYLAGPISFLKEQKTKGIDKIPEYEEEINRRTRMNEYVFQKAGVNIKKLSLLKVVHVLNQPSTLLEFILTNDTKEEIKTTQILGKYNKIVMVKPNGEETECFTSVKEKDIKTLTIKPTEKQSWRIDLLQVGKDYGVTFDDPGTYKVYWKLINDKGETKEEIKSEPVLFLKEAEKKPEDKQPPRAK